MTQGPPETESPNRGEPARGRAASRGPSRREFVASAGVTVLALAGCQSGDDSDEETIETHPAATALADQPSLGPDPATADATLIAFEDPSCSRCRAFERQTVPKIKSELTDPGLGAFVFRGYPVVYPWGEPATKALEATFDREEAAFWRLKDHYYDTQSSFDNSNVLDRTESFLAAETDLDAGAVVSDVRSGRFDDAVQVDLDAGEAAGIGRTTPIVLLFKDGTYVTEATGSVSYSLIENTLDL